MSTTAAIPVASVPARDAGSLPSLIEREERRRRRRRGLAWALAAALPLAGAGVWYVARPRPVPMAERFRVEAATVGDVLRDVQATGRLEAESTVNVGAEISGRLASVEVDYNDTVRAGQVLARFDPESLRAQRAQLEATLAAARAALGQAQTDRDQARANLSRADRLFAGRYISPADHDAARFALRAAEDRVRAAAAQIAAQEATLRVARVNLEHAEVRSPIDGVIITRNVDPGQAVASAFQTPVLFSVAADLRRMRVLAAVDEADVGQVRDGQRAEFTVTAYPDRVFAGTVTEVRNAPVVVQDVVTYGTVIEVSNEDLALKPGMTASVRVRTGAARGVLRVPNTALHFTPPGQSTGAGLAVWTLDGERLRRVPVRAGLADLSRTAVEPGAVTPGERVLVGLTPAGRGAYGLGR